MAKRDFFTALFVLGSLAAVGSAHDLSGKPTRANNIINSEDYALPVLKQFDWYKGGFNSVMILSKIVVSNNTKHREFYDFTVSCNLYAPSGTLLQTIEQVVYERVPAGKTRTFRNINMGFLRLQVATAGCQITDTRRAYDIDWDRVKKVNVNNKMRTPPPLPIRKAEYTSTKATKFTDRLPRE